MKTLLGMFSEGWYVNIRMNADYGHHVEIRGLAVHQHREPIDRRAKIEIPWSIEGGSPAQVDEALAAAILRVMEELRLATEKPEQRPKQIKGAPKQLEGE